MKNILTPTDFSACAIEATKVTLALAEFTGAKMHLVHTITKNKNRISSVDLEQEHRNVNTLFKEWIKQAGEKRVDIITSCMEGNLVQNIQEYIDTNTIDFVVMGSHGASGKNEYLIGSNTQKVIRKVHCPVFIVKDSMANYGLGKIVFASNFDPSERPAFQYLLDFVRPFNPEIHLVAINTGSWFGQPYLLVKECMDDFVKMCAPLTCKTHFYRNLTIEGGIRQFSEEIGADLIAMSNINKHPLKRIFSGSNVEALVNHSKAPVLSIDIP